MKKNYKKPFVYLFLISCLMVSIKAHGQSSTVTVGLGPTPQNVNLGLYGDKTVTQINLTCTTTASKYYWEIDGPWQTTTGLTNSFSTTTNHISLVTLSGYSGCESGSVSVSNSNNQQLRTSHPLPGVSIASTFSYIVGLSHVTPFVNVIMPSNYAGNCYVSNVSPTVTYQLSISPASSYVSFTPTSTQPNGLAGTITATVSPLPAGFEYSGNFTDHITVSGSPNCTVTLTHPVNMATAATFEANGVGGTDGGGTDDCIEVENEEGVTIVCYHFNSIVKIHPNPTTGEVKINLGDSNPASISLFNQSGVLMASKESVVENLTWDVSTIPDGLYFIKVNHGGKTTVERILIKK